MRRPPGAGRSAHSDPGGNQARADGQRVEVRTFEGELVGKVPRTLAAQLLDAKAADEMPHGLRLKLGIRWLPTRLDKPSGRPDLAVMQRRDPERYAEVWRGNRKALAQHGRGMLGRRGVDGLVFRATESGSKGGES
jgi:hypothetical protein